MGYRNKFIHIIQVAYVNIQSKISLLSESFSLIQRVYQGCPLSILLYILSTEVLAIFIDVNKRIKGVEIGGHENKILNFADDTAIFLRDINYLTLIQSILKLY